MEWAEGQLGAAKQDNTGLTGLSVVRLEVLQQLLLLHDLILSLVQLHPAGEEREQTNQKMEHDCHLLVIVRKFNNIRQSCCMLVYVQ